MQIIFYIANGAGSIKSDAGFYFFFAISFLILLFFAGLYYLQSANLQVQITNLLKRTTGLFLHWLGFYGKILSANLCHDMKVSEDTVSRDLQEFVMSAN